MKKEAYSYSLSLLSLLSTLTIYPLRPLNLSYLDKTPLLTLFLCLYLDLSCIFFLYYYFASTTPRPLLSIYL
ncbi:hypothetical protein KJE20_05915 [Pyrenophora tritici-repentis]|nr:hypothetical protein KJE20_05915 [Pyrenophora tritici-repentis]